jgi:hypothetical protein
MTLTTTLAALREKCACVSRYNKLACHVGAIEFNESMEEWVEVDHQEAIPLQVIVENNGLDDALWALRAIEQTPDLVRAERLFAVWCARRVQHLMRDERSVAMLDVAERHANGLATDDELAAARDAWAAKDAARAAAGASRDAASAAAMAAWAAARAAASDEQKQMFIAVFCGDEIDIKAMYRKESQ